MRNRMGVSKTLRFAAIATVMIGAVALFSASKPAFTKHEKAFFADPSIVAFVRPGLVVQIESASIASDAAPVVELHHLGVHLQPVGDLVFGA